jgi:hypothetical protein
MIEKSDIESKPKLNPAETKMFFGNTYETTPSENERITSFILEKTNARLIYQHHDFAYLKIVRSEVKADE